MARTYRCIEKYLKSYSLLDLLYMRGNGNSELTNITLNVIVQAKQTSMANVVVHDVSLCVDFLIFRRTVSCL